ncbi:SUB2 [Enterospora canceri]|uniref:RNA helicase n=1 Tax=Enterospora canceri TaxID=1081671 RepID=A0A1Y1S7W6_9MICR|nr:SUB2 [Enterospora canceri]
MRNTSNPLNSNLAKCDSTETISTLEDYDEKNNEKYDTTIHETTATASFTDFGLNSRLLQNIKAAQFEQPSPVQALAIPKMLLGRDVLCQAKSGTGKTAVFVVATVEQTLRDPKTKTVVCCNTPEMAEQVHSEYTRFTRGMNINTINLNSSTDQYIDQNIDQNISIFIGEIDALLRHRRINSVKNALFVLDECDQIINHRGLRTLLSRIHPKSVNMFTATLTQAAKRAALALLRDPYELYVHDDTQLTLYGLKQFYREVKEREKLETTQRIIDGSEAAKIIVFCNRPQSVAYLATMLRHRRVLSATDCDGDGVRAWQLRLFKESRTQAVLAATDVMARGIDVRGVELVINYDMPHDPETYLHRVGRAGRFETEGVAVNYISGIKDRMRMKEVMNRYEVDVKVM